MNLVADFPLSLLHELRRDGLCSTGRVVRRRYGSLYLSSKVIREALQKESPELYSHVVSQLNRYY